MLKSLHIVGDDIGVRGIDGFEVRVLSLACRSHNQNILRLGVNFHRSLGHGLRQEQVDAVLL